MSTTGEMLEDGGATLKTSLSREVYDKLLEKFMRNELVPGTILNRRTLAQELGVSVAPVLEALLQLEMEGFIESIPRKGTIVRPVRQEDVYGQLMLREAIECQAARLSCGQAVRDRRAELEPLAQALEVSASDTPEHWKKEIGFHGFLVGLAGVPALEQEFMRIIRLGSFFRLNRILTPSDRFDRLSHVDLVEEMSHEDPDRAERAVRAHLRSGKRRLILR